VRVIAVQSDGSRMDCCDEDTTHVWVRVLAWSPRRAFLTGAGPFTQAAGVPAAELAGWVFLAELDLDAIPENDDTAGERLEWPGLRVAPPVPGGWVEGPAGGHQPEKIRAASLLPAGGPEFDGERARLLASALAPGVTEYTSLVFEGDPASKARPRFTKEGRVYKTDEDTAAEAATAWHLRRAFRQPWTGNLALGCVLFRPNRQRIDTDNLIKHICDAGNGIGWIDDAQFTAKYGVLELDAERPRTIVVVARHVSSLDRSNVAKKPRAARRKAR
jgi:Holliday junction resolvase RusA-like endonuclease